MKHPIVLSLVTALCAFGVASSFAGDHSDQGIEKHTVIALKTGDFELAETDISDLAVGEVETIVTESGKTIDLLRTEEGVEVYVDGELLEMSFGDEAGAHGAHETVHKRVEVVCVSEDDCEKTVWVSDGDEVDVESLNGDGEHKVIHKTIRIECDGDDECADHATWISEGEEFDLESLHEHGEAHGVVMIRKGEGDLTTGADADVEVIRDGHGEKVIIIKKAREEQQ